MTNKEVALKVIEKSSFGNSINEIADVYLKVLYLLDKRKEYKKAKKYNQKS